ncbi:MAG TPA: hypothetical protein VLS49_15005 [Usitatibacter sp.]|nr:hypothetical protein [Usitatibacter sp.]
MTRTTHDRIAWTSAAALALALAAAFAADRRDAAPPPAAASPQARAPSLLDTLTLLRWGQGALDWNLPDVKGERHARIATRRG